ncbi:MAG TPA: hypothetical protein VNH12_08045 [Burkholderiales bacterium]|nr:hypothetical protein [Burkholderiales bacterium]
MAKSRSLVTGFLAAGLLCSWQQPLYAQAASGDPRVSDLEKKIEQMSERIKQLESGTNTGSKGAAPAAAQEPAAGTGHMSMQSADQGVPFHGFADVGGGVRQGGPNGFTTGSLDMYLAPQFSDRVRALFEALIEFDEQGNAGIDLERAQIGYAFRDELTVWGGRFHSPYGYYNTAFHHGQLMQTSIKKPKFLDFEDKGGILPAHSVGAWATGKIALGEGKFAYDIYAANSPSITDNTLNMNNVASRNHNASTGLNLGYLALEGRLKAGAHYYRARVVDDSDPINVTNVSFAGPYAVFDDGVWEAMFEYYGFNNNNVESNTGAPTGKHRSSAWFAQLGRRFGAWTPYARYEKASLDQQDNYFALQTNGRSYTRELGGLRYEVNPRAAFTVELNHTKQDDPTLPTPSYNELRIQYAIGF